ncbi:MAG: hypothetical protein QOD57_3237 [Actinomycetota bacterium]|nr:hypothetical protein [Actinomycetota bacterium]
MASHLDGLLARALRDGRPPWLAVVGNGGMGKSEFLDGLAAACARTDRRLYRCRGHQLETEIDLGALEDLLADADADADAGRANRHGLLGLLDLLGGEPGCGGTLLVDDAQWLDAGTLEVLVAVAERAAGSPDLGLVVAHRPVSGNAGLTALDAALSRRDRVLWLGPLAAAEVAERVAGLVGATPDPALLEALMLRTEGVPLWIDRLLAAWLEVGVVKGGRLAGDPTSFPEVATAVVRTHLDRLAPAARAVLGAFGVGASLENELLDALFESDPQGLAEALDSLRAAGLLSPVRPAVVPLVAEAVDALTPLPLQRELHARLAAVLTHRGAPAARVAEHLVAAGGHGHRAAEILLRAADDVRCEAPDLAREWYEAAVRAGADPAPLAARRAEAAALAGAHDDALRLADELVADPDGPDRSRGLEVLAGTLAQRGQWPRAADLYLALSRTGTAVDGVRGRFLAVPALVASGRLEEARAAAAEAERAAERPAPLHLSAAGLAAEGVLESLGPGIGRAMACFLEAAELLDVARPHHVLPDTPHAVGALVALAAGDPGAAEHLLERAVRTGPGGPGFVTRHRLLLGWVGLRTGRWAVAQGALDALGGPAAGLGRRDALWAFALDAGLARRTEDVPRLNIAWAGAKAEVLRHPADLFSVEPLGELAVAAARLGEWRVIEPRLDEAHEVLRALGRPPLWSLPLRWCELLAGVALEDGGAVGRSANAVVEVVPVSTRLSALERAARAWADVVDGLVDPVEVGEAARGLRGLGFTWEAAQLAGSAAARSPDARSLLELARDLKAALPAVVRGSITPAEPLSEREHEVASLVLAGLTHKQIGAQLFISPKTVEHHVAKIRQRLGATTRAELLAGLQAER